MSKSTPPPIETAAPGDAPAMRLQSLGKSYGGVSALYDFSLTIAPGEGVALLGRNGAGKSTALGLALGLLKPDQGSARIFGHRPDAPRARALLGALPQRAALPATLSVREILTIAAARWARPIKPGALADELGLAAMLERPYQALSGGYQRLTQFAVAAIGAPALLVLDEPTTGLDIDARRRFWGFIRDRRRAGTALLFSTHYLDEVEFGADRVALLHDGALIADDSPAALKAKLALRRILCRTALARDFLETLPGVVRAETDQDRAILYVDAAEACTRALLAADPDLSALEIHAADLESAVIGLTQAQTTLGAEAGKARS